jgi:hypothetical protein
VQGADDYAQLALILGYLDSVSSAGQRTTTYAEA